MAGESAGNFKESLKLKRRAMSPGNRARTISIKGSLWLYPFAWEKAYHREYIKRLRPMFAMTRNRLNERLESWISNSLITDSEKKHFDDYIDELNQLTNDLTALQIEEIGPTGTDPPESPIWPMFLLIASGVFGFNGKQWDKVTKQILGFPFQTSNHWWPEVEKAWANENYSLFKNVTDDYIAQVNETVSRGIRTGGTQLEIMKEISQVIGKTRNRAALITRDQIGKLTGKITERRMTEAGINEYIWKTALDEKVRGNPSGLYPKAIPNHFIMEGMICKWDDNTVYADPITDVDPDTGIINWRTRTAKMPIAIPGEEIQCRCTGIPYWNSLLKSIDQELENERSVA